MTFLQILSVKQSGQKTFLISEDRHFCYTEHLRREFRRIYDLYRILTVTPFELLLMFHIKDP